MGIQEVTNDGLCVRMNCRLARPSYGWPAQKRSVMVHSGRRYLRQAPFDGTNNFIPVPVGKSEVQVTLPEAESGGPQLVGVFAETFEVQVEYESESLLAVGTIGASNVILRGNPLQDGRLGATESFEEGRRLRATFAFERHPRAYKKILSSRSCGPRISQRSCAAC